MSGRGCFRRDELLRTAPLAESGPADIKPFCSRWFHSRGRPDGGNIKGCICTLVCSQPGEEGDGGTHLHARLVVRLHAAVLYEALCARLRSPRGALHTPGRCIETRGRRGGTRRQGSSGSSSPCDVTPNNDTQLFHAAYMKAAYECGQSNCGQFHCSNDHQHYIRPKGLDDWDDVM